MNSKERENLKRSLTQIPKGYRELRRGEVINSSDLSINNKNGSLFINNWVKTGGAGCVFGYTWNHTSPNWRMIRKERK